MYIDQIRTPDISEICNDAQQYRTAFLAAGCRAVTSSLKLIFGALIAVAGTACRSSVRLLNPRSNHTSAPAERLASH